MFITFHKSVRGYLHEQKGRPMEDDSRSFSEPQGSYHILAVSDGHGDPACLRSAFGASTAVQIAEDRLKALAVEVLRSPQSTASDCPHEAVTPSWEERLTIPHYRQAALRQLSNSILAGWSAAVLKDLNDHPLKTEEYELAGDRSKDYRDGKHLEHIYGATLICGLLVKDFLILLQQGDGRCDVFYADGTVDQPIPWDNRCHENITTSLCDGDAAEHVRGCVIDLRKKGVIACFMGSDGVEDSYVDMEGTHNFYRNLICERCGQEAEDFARYLAEMLPDFSRTGSGDDVSVAGLMDLKACGAFRERFQRQTRRYQLNDDLKRCQERIPSMERKLGILKRKLDTLQNTCQEKKHAIEAEQRQLQLQRQKMLHNRYPQTTSPIFRSTQPIQDNSIVTPTGVPCLFPFQSQFQSNIISRQRKLNVLHAELETLEKEFASQLQEYKEYEGTYQAVRSQCQQLQEEIQRLLSPDDTM